MFATEKSIRSVVDMCREFGIAVIKEPRSPMLATVAAYADQFSNIVTDDQRILYHCSEGRAISLWKDLRSMERVTPDGVQRNLAFSVQHVPTYLALTEGCKQGRVSSDDSQLAVTTREAR